MMMKKKPHPGCLAVTSLVAALTLSSTAYFASAINDYGGLRGNPIANSNDSIDIWGREPGTSSLNEVKWEGDEGDESSSLVEVEQLEEEWNEEEEWDEEEGDESLIEVEHLGLGEELEEELEEVEAEEVVAEWEELGEALEEVKQEEMEMAAQLRSVDYFCGCPSCTQAVMSQKADGHSCAARIDWVIRNKGMSSLSACKFVADEFPSICGRCHADRCGSAPTPTPGVSAGVMTARDVSWLKEHNDRRQL